MTTVIATTNFDWAKIEHYCATLKSEVSGERFGCDGFWVSLPVQRADAEANVFSSESDLVVVSTGPDGLGRIILCVLVALCEAVVMTCVGLGWHCGWSRRGRRR